MAAWSSSAESARSSGETHTSAPPSRSFVTAGSGSPRVTTMRGTGRTMPADGPRSPAEAGKEPGMRALGGLLAASLLLLGGCGGAIRADELQRGVQSIGALAA